MTKIAILAGEASGDLHGANLLKALGKKYEFIGVGGPKMNAVEGFNSLFPMHEISLMGFLEIIPHIANIYNRINQTVEYILKHNPDVVVTIDSPGFNYRVAERLKKYSYKGKLVHYIAPTVWAYNEKRARKYAKIYDKMLAILPFEPPYFTKYGLECEFIGHPIFDEIKSEIKLERKLPKTPKICLMAGSRVGEVKKLLPTFIETLEILNEKLGKIEIVIPTFPHLKDEIELQLLYTSLDYKIITDDKEKANAFKDAHFGLIKSGTSGLEAAMHGVPHLVGYKTNPITAWLVRRVIKIKYAHLVNIVLNKYAVPEFIQHNFTAEKLAEKAYLIMMDQDLQEKQINSFIEAKALLQSKNKASPSKNAAKAIESML